MNFIFSEVWWMNTIIAAIITGMFTLICSYIAYSYKIRKGLDTIERMEHTQESRQKELSGQHEKMSEKLSQEHQQISRDIRPYADKIVRIDSHMTDLVQRANQQDSLYHSLSREQQKMSDFSLKDGEIKCIAAAVKRHCLVLAGKERYAIEVGTLPYEEHLFGKGGGQ